jgi:hypothetical protein
MKALQLDKLTDQDLEKTPVWEFVEPPGTGEQIVRSTTVPVRATAGKLFAVQITFADSTRHLGLFTNVSRGSSVVTRHFITLSVWHANRWLRLPRYHDADWSPSASQMFAAEFARSQHEVFPIAFDLRHLVTSEEANGLVGEIAAEPDTRLSEDDLVRLSFRLGDE